MYDATIVIRTMRQVRAKDSIQAQELDIPVSFSRLIEDVMHAA